MKKSLLQYHLIQFSTNGLIVFLCGSGTYSRQANLPSSSPLLPQRLQRSLVRMDEGKRGLGWGSVWLSESHRVTCCVSALAKAWLTPDCYSALWLLLSLWPSTGSASQAPFSFLDTSNLNHFLRQMWAHCSVIFCNR